MGLGRASSTLAAVGDPTPFEGNRQTGKCVLRPMSHYSPIVVHCAFDALVVFDATAHFFVAESRFFEKQSLGHALVHLSDHLLAPVSVGEYFLRAGLWKVLMLRAGEEGDWVYSDRRRFEMVKRRLSMS